MPTFPRGLQDADGANIEPVEMTWPTMPDSLISEGFSGKLQVRETAQAGFAWTEETRLLDPTNANSRKFIAQARLWKRQGTILDVEHLMITQLGVGGGTPLVNGASQTGSSISTDGWPTTTTDVVKAGDFIRFAGMNRSFEVTADASSDGGGVAVISINPSIFAGDSPTNGNAVTIAAAGTAFFKARIIAIQMPKKRPQATGKYMSQLKLAFKEAV